MPEIVTTLNFYLALGTILLQVATVGIIVDWYVNNGKYLWKYISPYVLPIAFVTSFGSAFMTLLYSEVFGFLPCGLCWLERVFLYPQVLMTAIAIVRKETKAIYEYGIVLSIVGALISLYHHYLQTGGVEFVPCPASGGDCSKRILYEFDYVTFPLMAFTIFAFLIVIFYIARKNRSGI